MNRAAKLLIRAWSLVGRVGPFTVGQPVAEAEEYTLWSVGTDAAQPAAWAGEVDLGEVPCHLSATTRPEARHTPRQSRPAARHGLQHGTRGPRC